MAIFVVFVIAALAALVFGFNVTEFLLKLVLWGFAAGFIVCALINLALGAGKSGR